MPELEPQLRKQAYTAIRISHPQGRPSPEALEQYEEALPGLAKRMIIQWESEGEHRKQLDNRDMRLQERAQFITAALILIAMILGATIVLIGKDIGIAIPILMVLLSIIARLIYPKATN